ncbi:ribose transport system ATP-binding protein [Comamonas odontotermitis]|uniref:Ribose transport system ATP-binding protein n=1 Tax=Comamonas odontotermitis TaxID=379895 RepID=A0ABR6RB94_9BURK|nr:sugar ABC transporter ATP-binding protein [Comamonas odontotermitis]MBB6576423.1 ribose transport system ATP-binding protein [Comamonas odontotermitis]
MNAMENPGTPRVRLQDIGKAYSGTTVLQGVSLDLHAGEVLALTGENGAGKSTLSKILCGLTDPSQGSMQLDGQPFAPASRRDAEHHGVRMVMQELGLIPTLSVAENLLLGRLPHHMGWLDHTAMRALAVEQLAKIGMTGIDPDTPVSQLGIGQQQMVEIARNLRDGTRVLVLDEPTAMLTPKETEHLFEQIALLKARGVALVYVSHRLEELQRIADRVAVLRDGRLVDVRPMAGVQEHELVERMVGHAVQDNEGRPRRARGALRLSARNMQRGRLVRGVSLDLYAGEIMGLAGLVGSGRTELARLLFGADRADAGEITVHAGPAGAAGVRTSASVTPNWRNPVDAIRAGIGLVTEDRKSQGLLLSQSIRANTTLAGMRKVARAGWLQRAQESAVAQHFIERLRIRSRGPEQAVSTLSGGNQQKVVFARWLHQPCDVLLLDEPTRGVDVGARADIYHEVDRMCDDGKAVLMVSSDLRELMAMCDRIGVMHNGQLVAVFERGQWTDQQLLAAAFGNTGTAGATQAA